MESEGWIKLHRQFLEWEWHDSPETVTLFVHLLLMANHEDRKWHGGVIGRGQVLTSLDKLAKFVHLTMQKLRTCLVKLEQTGEITRKSTNKYTIITISKYDRYQVKEEGHQQTNNNQITNNQQTNNNQITTNKNEKNIYINKLDNTRTREESSLSSWRFVSSVAKSNLGFDKDRIFLIRSNQAEAL